MFLPKLLILSCMIIHDIVGENIFVVIGYKLLVQKKNQKFILKTDLKLMVNKES